jgi:hypothetical protein
VHNLERVAAAPGFPELSKTMVVPLWKSLAVYRRRERAKLGYFWRHAYRIPRSGPYLGCVVNSDTGKPVIVDESRLTTAEFEKVKIVETIETRPCRRN